MNQNKPRQVIPTYSTLVYIAEGSQSVQTQLLLDDVNSKDVLQEVIQRSAITEWYPSHRTTLGLVWIQNFLKHTVGMWGPWSQLVPSAELLLLHHTSYSLRHSPQKLVNQGNLSSYCPLLLQTTSCLRKVNVLCNSSHASNSASIRWLCMVQKDIPMQKHNTRR